MFAGIFLLLFFIIWCFIDNFRRRDHRGLAKAGWTVLILVVPFFGAVDLHHRQAGGRPAFDLNRVFPPAPVGGRRVRFAPGSLAEPGGLRR